MERPRFDGLATWYDEEIRRLDITSTALNTLARLLGPGSGRCLDLGCGTGIAVPDLIKSGWTVVGVDISEDQLRVARANTAGPSVEFINADAANLPFPDGTYDAVVSMFTHTDFDDYARVLAEVCRVLRPGRRFVYVGTHPCYVTPYVERRRDGPHRLHPGYRCRGWTKSGPGFGHGIRPRVGVNHSTLGDFLQAIIDSGLRLRRVEEPGDDDYPILISLVAER
ncbi:MAG TPA: class I SAM-dependent methyltransferase [Candidatus Dormibacteraeota bacterium]|nr:class I SAM-dependent methyltransferase [Candidatus Dormibacteraeota bacterium]